MARTIGKVWLGTNPVTQLLGRKASTSMAGKLLQPANLVAQNAADGKPLTTRSLIDPGGMVLQALPKAPPPPPVFPDVEGATLAARRNVRRRGISGGVGSTILTGGYSPTGQASASLGGG